MNDPRKLFVVGVGIGLLAWWLATAPESPFVPKKPQRPVMQFLAKVARVAARVGLTALMFCETSPDADEVQVVHAAIGSDGYQQLDNARW